MPTPPPRPRHPTSWATRWARDQPVRPGGGVRDRPAPVAGPKGDLDPVRGAPLCRLQPRPRGRGHRRRDDRRAAARWSGGPGWGAGARRDPRSLRPRRVAGRRGTERRYASPGQAKAPWRERKEGYLRHLAGASPSVLRVSLADKLHNARSILADLRADGDAVWDRFNAGRQEQAWYYTPGCWQSSSDGCQLHGTCLICEQWCATSSDRRRDRRSEVGATALGCLVDDARHPALLRLRVLGRHHPPDQRASR